MKYWVRKKRPFLTSSLYSAKVVFIVYKNVSMLANMLSSIISYFGLYDKTGDSFGKLFVWINILGCQSNLS